MVTTLVVFLALALAACGVLGMFLHFEVEERQKLFEQLLELRTRTAHQLVEEAERLDPFAFRFSGARTSLFQGFTTLAGDDIQVLKIVLPPTLPDSNEHSQPIQFQQAGPPLVFTLEGRAVPGVTNVTLDFDERFGCVRGVLRAQNGQGASKRYPFQATSVAVTRDWDEWNRKVAACAAARNSAQAFPDMYGLGARIAARKQRWLTESTRQPDIEPAAIDDETA